MFYPLILVTDKYPTSKSMFLHTAQLLVFVPHQPFDLDRRVVVGDAGRASGLFSVLVEKITEDEIEEQPVDSSPGKSQ